MMSDAKENWNLKISILKRSFLKSLLVSTAPFLAIILFILILFSILSRIFTLRKKYRRTQSAMNEKILENFLILVTDARAQRKQSTRQALDVPDRRKASLIRNWSFSNLNLSDEDKVPIVLLKDVLNRSLAAAAAEAANENGPQPKSKTLRPVIKSTKSAKVTLNNLEKIKMDQDIIKIINDLVYPEYAESNRRKGSLFNLRAVKKTLQDGQFNINNNKTTVEDPIRLNPLLLESDKYTKNNRIMAAKNNKLLRSYLNKNFNDDESTVQASTSPKVKTNGPIQIIVEDYDETKSTTTITS